MILHVFTFTWWLKINRCISSKFWRLCQSYPRSHRAVGATCSVFTYAVSGLLFFFFGGELVDDIRVPQAVSLEGSSQQSSCLTVLSERCGRIWVFQSCVACAVFVATVFFHRLWSIVSFQQTRLRTDLDFGDTCSLSMFPATFDMFSSRQARTKEGVQECD